MPSNVQLNAGSGGAIATTKQITHDGDTTQCQGVHLLGITGTEDAYTAGTIGGDATNGLDVDVTRVIPGTTATALGKAEDVAHASGDVGVLALAVRRDAAAVGSDTDGDASTLNVNSVGRLYTTATVDAALPAGTNNIGDVDVLTLPALPAGTNNIGDVDVLTVPAPLSTTGGGTEAAALRVTLANDSTGVVSVDDNGGSITIDGSVSLASAIPAGANNIGDVDVLSVPAPLSTTGGGTEAAALRVTLASDSTGLVSVDDNGASLTVDGSVSLAAAIPAGSNNIGDVDVLTMPAVYAEDAAHSTGENGVLVLGVRRDTNTSLVDTDGDRAPFQVDANGNVKVAIISGAGSGGTAIQDSAAFTAGTTNLTPIGGYRDDTTPDTVAEGEAAAVRITTNRAIHVNLRDASGNEVSVGGGTQYAEDAASVGGEQLTLAGAVRQDTLASNTSLDGDYTYLKTTAAGRLYTSATVDAALPAGTNNIGDVDVLSLPSLPAGTNNIGDVDVLTVPAPLNVTGTGTEAAALRVTIASDSTGVLSVDDNGGSLTIDGSVSITGAIPAGTNNIGDVDVLTLPALPAGTNNIGDVDVLSVPADPFGLNADAASATGSISAKLRFIASTGIPVTALPASTNTLEVVGDVAHDAAVGGNPVLVAARANANEPTAVADGDSTHLWADLLGRLVVLPGHPSPEPPVTANGSGAGVTVIAAPGASQSLHICKGVVTNSAAAEQLISLRDGAAGTIRWTINAAADGGGATFDFGPRGWKLTANTALVMDASAATAYINVTEYYIAP